MALAACGGAAPRPALEAAPGDARPMLGETWFAARARTLGLSVEAARARDAALSETQPPDDGAPPDAQLAAQAEALWRSVCASCHGATGRLENVPPSEPRPRVLGTFGMSMGFFFGGDKMRAGLYRKIARGEPPAKLPSPMPKWEGQLSREQIWALVAHIEGL